MLKRLTFISLCLLSLFFFFSCASVEKKEDIKIEPDLPPLFEDWQYRGFATEYPAWCEVILFNKDQEELQSFFPQIQGRLEDVYCLRLEANSVDNCSASLTNEELFNTGDTLLAKTWVKINPYYEQFDIPYYSLILFIKDTQEEPQ